MLRSSRWPTPDALDDDLEDDADPLENPTRDLSRPVRKLAAAVLVRAVLDSKMLANPYFKEDATRFLYPSSECARADLRMIAELAGLSPAWLNECLVRTAKLTEAEASELREVRVSDTAGWLRAPFPRRSVTTLPPMPRGNTGPPKMQSPWQRGAPSQGSIGFPY
jgi:hypothetical protein